MAILLPRRVAIAISFLALCANQTGCGGKIEAASTPPRLQRTSVALEGGATWFTGIFDTHFGRTCVPGRFADGVVRCVVAGTQLGGGTGAYADASCKRPAQPKSPSAETPWSMSIGEIPNCFLSLVAVYADGAPVAQPYRLDPSGACVPAPTSGGVASWVEQGPEVDPQTFATLHVQPVDTGIGVQRNAWIDDDGQDLGNDPREPFTSPDGACAPSLAEDGARRCLPTQAAFVAIGAFSDSACTQRFGMTECPVGTEPAWARESMMAPASAVSARTRVWATSKYDLRELYTLDGPQGACAPFPDGAISTFAAPLNDWRPADGFVAMPTLSESGTGRVRVRSLYGVQWTLHDGVLDEDCRLGDDGTGTRRCLPSSGYGADLAFADPKCTQQVIGVDERLEHAPKYVALAISNGGERRAYEVTSLTRTAYRMRDGACTPVQTTGWDGIAPNFPAWAVLGASVPMSTFAVVP